MVRQVAIPNETTLRVRAAAILADLRGAAEENDELDSLEALFLLIALGAAFGLPDHDGQDLGTLNSIDAVVSAIRRLAS